MSKNNGAQKSPEIIVRDFTSSLNKIAKLNDEMIEISKQMTNQAMNLARSGIPLDTMFHQQVSRLSVIFQTAMVEGMRAKNDYEDSIKTINSLEGRLIKVVDVPKKRDIILP